MTRLALTINGHAHGPVEVRDDLSMNDFLREYLGMTGTKFGCGAAQCLSCAIIIDNPDGTSYTSPTCIVSAASFDGKKIRTVEGHAKGGELSALQKAFIAHFSVPVRLLHCPAFSTKARCCSSALPGHRCRATSWSRPLPTRSTGICAAAPATSNITRRCAT